MILEFFSTLDILFTPSIINYYLIIDFIVIILTILSIIIYKYLDKRSIFIIISNVILEILFNCFLFNNNYFFMFTTKLIQFIFSIHLNEIVFINKKSARLYIPYVIWNYILTLLTIVLVFLNISIY